MDVNRLWVKARVNSIASQLPRSISVCTYAILPESPIVYIVGNAMEDSRFCNSPLVLGPPNIRSYVGAAIIVNGYKIGTLCYFSKEPMLPSSQDKLELSRLANECSKLLTIRRDRNLQDLLASRNLFSVGRIVSYDIQGGNEDRVDDIEDFGYNDAVRSPSNSSPKHSPRINRDRVWMESVSEDREISTVSDLDHRIEHEHEHEESIDEPADIISPYAVTEEDIVLLDALTVPIPMNEHLRIQFVRETRLLADDNASTSTPLPSVLDELTAQAATLFNVCIVYTRPYYDDCVSFL